eukprot:scaffold2558_cov172-Amphora_coffeaeformis.AAC.2
MVCCWEENRVSMSAGAHLILVGLRCTRFLLHQQRTRVVENAVRGQRSKRFVSLTIQIILVFHIATVHHSIQRKMFDFEDFVVCVEALLLGPERAQELWQRQTPVIPTTWRTPVNDRDSDHQSVKEDSASSRFVLEFVDIIFSHKANADKKSSCPLMQLGAFFSNPSANTDATEDSLSPVYVLSLPLSAKDIADHYDAIGAELDEYSSDEHLNLAKMFVKSLRNFHQTPVPTSDKVVLFYQEFDTSLKIPLNGASRQQVAAPVAAAALLGLENSSRFTVDNNEENDDKITTFRELVKASRSKDSPIKSKPDDSPKHESKPAKSTPSKTKPANRKRTQRAVLQKRAKATKLLPKENHTV